MVTFPKIKITKSIFLDLPIIIVFIAAAAYSFWFKYHRWEAFTPSMDYHSYLQMMWNSRHGDWLQYNGLKADVRMMFQYHFALILLPLAIGYFLVSHQLTLYFLSSVLLALSVIPLYLIGKKFLHSRLSAYLVCLIFLFYPPFINADLAGFSEEVLAIPFVLFALYFLMENKPKWFLFFCALLLSVKVNLTAVVFSLGVLAFFLKKRQLVLITCLASIIWLLFLIFYVPTKFPVPASEPGEANYIWWFFSAYGDTPQQIVTTMFTRPDIVAKVVFTDLKKNYIKDLFTPLAYLPLISPFTLFGLPIFSLNMLASHARLATVYNYYQSSMLPFIFLGLIHSISLLSRLIKKIITLKLIKISYLEPLIPLGILIFIIFFYAQEAMSARLLPFNKYYNPAFYTISEKDISLARLVKYIPTTFTIGMDEKFMEHLAERKFYYDSGKFDKYSPELILTDAQEWPKISEQLHQSDQYVKLFEHYYVNLFVQKDRLQTKPLSEKYEFDSHKAYLVYLPSKGVFRANDQDYPLGSLSLYHHKDLAQPFIAQGKILGKLTFIGNVVNQPQGNLVIKILKDDKNQPIGQVILEKKLSFSEFSQEKGVITVNIEPTDFVSENEFTSGNKYWLILAMDNQNSDHDRFDIATFTSDKPLKLAMTSIDPVWQINWKDNKIGLESVFYFDIDNASIYEKFGFMKLIDGSLLLSGNSYQVSSALSELRNSKPVYDLVSIVTSKSDK